MMIKAAMWFQPSENKLSPHIHTMLHKFVKFFDTNPSSLIEHFSLEIPVLNFITVLPAL